MIPSWGEYPGDGRDERDERDEQGWGDGRVGGQDRGGGATGRVGGATGRVGSGRVGGATAGSPSGAGDMIESDAEPPDPPDRRQRAVRPRTVRAEAVIDLDAMAANTRVLLARMREVNPAAEMMAVVKAGGYGHGAVPSARAALVGGATFLGVATPEEGLELRAAGIEAPILAWLWPAGQDIAPALAAGLDLGISGLDHLDAVLDTAAATGPARPRIHIKIDTGLGRNGVGPRGIAGVLDAVAAAQRAGRVQVVGLMSHLASADVPGDPSVGEQTTTFREVLNLARDRGVTARWHHLANTPAVLDHPDTYFDLGRCGIGLYGINPVATPAGLRPAMTLRGTIALTKRVPGGYGVSYGLTYRTATETTLALVPLGYADGIPRAAGGLAEVWLGGRRRRIAGRVAMDQFVVDCGDDPVAAGDDVIVFGPGDDGEPTAEDWAAACDTIGYEIVTRIGPRIPRRAVGRDADAEPGVVAGRSTGLQAGPEVGGPSSPEVGGPSSPEADRPDDRDAHDRDAHDRHARRRTPATGPLTDRSPGGRR